MQQRANIFQKSLTIASSGKISPSLHRYRSFDGEQKHNSNHDFSLYTKRYKTIRSLHPSSTQARYILRHFLSNQICKLYLLNKYIKRNYGISFLLNNWITFYDSESFNMYFSSATCSHIAKNVLCYKRCCILWLVFMVKNPCNIYTYLLCKRRINSILCACILMGVFSKSCIYLAFVAKTMHKRCRIDMQWIELNGMDVEHDEWLSQCHIQCKLWKFIQ